MPTADPSQSLRLDKLGFSLMQRVLGRLPVGNVDLGANSSDGPPGLIVYDEDTRLDPPHLTVAQCSKFQDDLGFAIDQGTASDGI